MAELPPYKVLCTWGPGGSLPPHFNDVCCCVIDENLDPVTQAAKLAAQVRYIMAEFPFRYAVKDDRLLIKYVVLGYHNDFWTERQLRADITQLWDLGEHVDAIKRDKTNATMVQTCRNSPKLWPRVVMRGSWGYSNYMPIQTGKNVLRQAKYMFIASVLCRACKRPDSPLYKMPVDVLRELASYFVVRIGLVL